MFISDVSFSPGQLLYLFYLLTFNNVKSFSKREMSDICSRSKCKCFASVSYLQSLFYLTFFVVEYFYFFLLANENTLISAKRGLLLLPGLAFLFIFKPIVLARFFSFLLRLCSVLYSLLMILIEAVRAKGGAITANRFNACIITCKAKQLLASLKRH